MGSLKVMIVDDSTFSIAVLKNMLVKSGLDVVATALTMGDAIEQAKGNTFDLITMDMTLPDGDGIECSREILKHVKDAKILAISSMMDEEIIKKAKDVGIKAYLQKPVNQNELNASIQRLFEGDELYKILTDNYEEAFKESIFSFLKREIGGEIVIEDNPINSTATRKSSGISVTIGIIGRHNGRCIIDMSDDTSLNMTRKILQDEDQSIDNAIAFLSEFTNVVAGNACSLLNGLNQSFGLRVSPPTVFRGNDITISIGDILSKSYKIKTNLGEVFMNAGFQKVGNEWH
ncbi:response regulator [Acetobacterium sp.]|uniref:response regulator n=1 Tax=Acetobacterium sp. TaxID=1872094 RepID=UPI002F3FD97F